MNTILAIEKVIVERLSSALTLPNEAKPKVEVKAWPDPRSYKYNHPVGAVLVIYKAGQYDHSMGSQGQMQGKTLHFELSIMARSLRDHVATHGDAVRQVGIYDLLEICGHALFGWKPELADAAIMPDKEQFSDYGEGVWTYELSIKVPVVQVFDIDDAHGPWLADGCNDAVRLTQLTMHPDGTLAGDEPWDVDEQPDGI